MVLDSHTHAWGAPSPTYPWTRPAGVIRDHDRFSVDPIYTAESLLLDMDRAGIDEAVVVGYPISRWDDNRYTVEVVERHDRFWGIGLIDLFTTDAADTLRDLMTTERIIGFRVAAMCARDAMWEGFDATATWLLDTLDNTAFWHTAVETDALVQLLVHHSQLGQVLELVERYPELTCVVDHVARVEPATFNEAGRVDGLVELAAHESVGVKVSEVPHMSAEPFPFRDMHDYVAWLVDQFGCERVMWGSDYPNGSGSFTYRETLEWLTHVPGLSSQDREWLTERAFRAHVGL